MKNQNRAVFHRTSGPYRFGLELPSASTQAARFPTARSLASPESRSRLRLWHWLSTLRKALQRRAQRQALLELSDAQLKDIGLSRSDAYGGYSRYRRSVSVSLERKSL